MSVTVMSFSGVYKEQEFYQSKRIDKRVEAEQVEETNCYCTEEAEEKIKKLIEPYPEKGIHFLDSGNYHYVTKFWMEKLTKPFALVLFDQHTDMQEAAFFGLLSCGSWVREALEQNELLKAVCVVGPPQKSIEEVFKSSKEEPWIDKVCFVSGEELEAHRQTAYDEFLKENSIPVYLSIDKDILRELILNENVYTTIFYLNRDVMGQQIANLVKIIGQDELIRRTGGKSKTIEFKQQKEC